MLRPVSRSLPPLGLTSRCGLDKTAVSNSDILGLYAVHEALQTRKTTVWPLDWLEGRKDS